MAKLQKRRPTAFSNEKMKKKTPSRYRQAFRQLWTSKKENLGRVDPGTVHDEEVASTLAPQPDILEADGGVQAYLFLIAALLIEAIMWALPLTYAVFLTYYETVPYFRGNRYLAVIGTLCTGIPFLGAPIITPITAKWHKYQRQMIWAGWAMCIAGLIAASFATKVWHLIVTQGVLYGLGFLVLYYALLSMLNEWFDKKRGLAYGILFAAAGISGTGLPFLMQIALDRFGFANTLRGYALAIFGVIGPALPLCKGRLPSKDDEPRQAPHWRTIKNPLFWLLSFSNLFQGLAFFLPGIYLPSFAFALGVAGFLDVLCLCLLNISQVIGQIALGSCSDHVCVFLLLALSTLGSSVLACALWLSASCFWHVTMFSILFGLFAGGYSVLYPRFVSVLTNDPATGLWLYSWFAFQRGMGNIIAGSISGLLLRLMTKKNFMTDPAAGFRPLILFVGTSLAISSVGGLGYFFRKRCARSL